MIYIVAGSPRTGTSMMMRALDKAGLPALHDYVDPDYDTTYDPHPNGKYESRISIKSNRFISVATDHVVKVPGTIVQCLPDHEYTVVFMMRNPSEIILSHNLTYGEHNQITYDYARDTQDEILSILRSRDDFNMIIMHYALVIENPIDAFRSLRDHGFPIDPHRASRVVDANLYRNRTHNT